MAISGMGGIRYDGGDEKNNNHPFNRYRMHQEYLNSDEHKAKMELIRLKNRARLIAEELNGGVEPYFHSSTFVENAPMTIVATVSSMEVQLSGEEVAAAEPSLWERGWLDQA